MNKLRAIATGAGLVVLLVCATAPASASVSISIGAPSVDIGIHFGALPVLTVVPGTPIYYAPSADANFFFYDGMYWVFQNELWYASSWYNGPWALVDPEIVPVYLLRVPVRYYRRPPAFFHGWARNAAPHWGEHYGHDWEEHHVAWSQVDKSHIPHPAPIPTYQRKYKGDKYPSAVEQQRALHTVKNYKYEPQEEVVRDHYAQHARPQEEHQEHVGGPAGEHGR